MGVRSADLWRTVREALAVILGIPPRDDAPGHERRTVVIVVGTIVTAAALVTIATFAHGYW